MEPPFYSVEFLDIGGHTIDVCWNPISLAGGRSFNNPGTLTLNLPRDWPRSIFRHMTRFKVWRTSHDYRRRLLGDTIWFLQDFHNQVSANQFVIECDDAFAIASKRIIAYTGETIYADKTLEAFDIGGGFTEYFRIDNLMRAYVRENFGPNAVDTIRNNSFTAVEGNRNFAPFGEHQGGWSELGSALSTLANLSADLGVQLFYDFIPQENGVFLFKVWKDVRHIDRGSTSTSPLILTDSGGALDDIIISDLYRDSRTVCYVLGTGSGAGQLFDKVEDASRVNEHPFARTEFVYNASDISNEAVLLQYGQAALYARRPKRTVSARVVDNSSFRYDEHATYGDRVEIQAESETFDAQISAFSVNFANSQESLDIHLSGERFL